MLTVAMFHGNLMVKRQTLFFVITIAHDTLALLDGFHLCVWVWLAAERGHLVRNPTAS